jgi:hypothetical protein
LSGALVPDGADRFPAGAQKLRARTGGCRRAKFLRGKPRARTTGCQGRSFSPRNLGRGQGGVEGWSSDWPTVRRADAGRGWPAGWPSGPEVGRGWPGRGPVGPAGSRK